LVLRLAAIGFAGVYVLLSILCISIALYHGIKSQNWIMFIEKLNGFSGIISTSIALVALIIAVRQVSIAIDSSKIAMKIKWKDNLEKVLENQSDGQPMNEFVKNHFYKESDTIFDYVYHRSKSMQISSGDELKVFFERFIMPHVSDFESGSNSFIENNRKYGSRDTLYAWKDLFTVLRFVVHPSESYSSPIIEDLRNMYAVKVREYAAKYDLYVN
jgi:hypothetical protein